MDQARGSIRELLAALQPMSVSPLIARQIPIREGERVTGFVDVALERAFHYVPGGKFSERIDIPEDLTEREHEARTQLLEQLADHDDELLEQLLMDQVPEASHVLRDLARETGENLGVPVLFGSAGNCWGVRRLLKALRHEAPGPAATARRLDVSDAALFAFKISNATAMGRVALARLLGGDLREGAEVKDVEGRVQRLGAIFTVQGDRTQKVTEARNGDLLALAKLENVRAGQWLGTGKLPPSVDVPMPALNCAIAIEPADRKDDVKLSGALAKLLEEDPALRLEQDEASHEMRLRGVNEEQLQTVLAKLKRRYGVEVRHRPPTIGYRESIRRQVTQRGRHKKQSGGHGQFGDVVIELQPLPRGEGFRFTETIHGGAIPRQFIPAVEQGVRDALSKGPLGFSVVDVAVTLTDGSYHSVDSSELAFRTAGRMAMQEALGTASPYLLEPVHRVVVMMPNSSTSRVTSAIASRRGQMLGIGPRDGWQSWDRIEALIPEAELAGLEAELRSLSQGLAAYEAEFDHLAELNGSLADRVIRSREPEHA
jgi:elongation factor G